MVDMLTIAVGGSFMFEGIVFTKISDYMARSEAGDYIADNRLYNPWAEPEMVTPC